MHSTPSDNINQLIKSAVTPEAVASALSNHDVPHATPNSSYAASLLNSESYMKEHPSFVTHAIVNDPALKNQITVQDNKIEPESLANAIRELALYQGVMAIADHQQAHALYENAQKLKQSSLAQDNPQESQTLRNEAAKNLWEARNISQASRVNTAGIEIHPGATIGDSLFIDHGAGVVIGETAKIGDKVFLYHNVTLGMTARGGKPLLHNDNGIQRRHPTIGNDALISTGVKILGPTVLDDDVKIAANTLMDGVKSVGKSTKIGDAVLMHGNGKLTVGENSTIKSGARILGDATIENNVHIGEAAQVLGNITIGAGAVIDAGVTVTHDVPAGMHVLGQAPDWMRIGTREKDGLIADTVQRNAQGKAQPLSPDSPDLPATIIQKVGALLGRITNPAERGIG